MTHEAKTKKDFGQIAGLSPSAVNWLLAGLRGTRGNKAVILARATNTDVVLWLEPDESKASARLQAFKSWAAPLASSMAQNGPAVQEQL